MNKPLSQFAVSVLAAVIYGALRVASTGKGVEAVASAVLAAACVFVLLQRKGVDRLSQVHLLFVPYGNALLCGAAALALGVMGVLRFGVPVHTAALDATFAFCFFLAFGSLFVRRPERAQ
jgi:hypothetical protein